MRTTQKKGKLYLLAKQAKNRLKNYPKEGQTPYYPYLKTTTYTNKDEILYRKVVKMLESDKIITNPIMELLDKSYYNSLPIESRQRYILELTDKYKKFKDEYLKEKSRTYSMVSNY